MALTRWPQRAMRPYRCGPAGLEVSLVASRRRVAWGRGGWTRRNGILSASLTKALLPVSSRGRRKPRKPQAENAPALTPGGAKLALALTAHVFAFRVAVGDPSRIARILQIEVPGK